MVLKDDQSDVAHWQDLEFINDGGFERKRDRSQTFENVLILWSQNLPLALFGHGIRGHGPLDSYIGAI